MVNRKKYTKFSVLEEKEKNLIKSTDEKYFLFKYYKVGETEEPSEMAYKALQMDALCSNYCNVEKFITDHLIDGKEEVKNETPKQNTFWEDHLRYRKCILEKAFDSEKNKCKELYEWMYRPDPHNM